MIAVIQCAGSKRPGGHLVSGAGGRRDLVGNTRGRTEREQQENSQHSDPLSDRATGSNVVPFLGRSISVEAGERIRRRAHGLG